MALGGWRRRWYLGTNADRATFRTLHTASLMAGALREGLTASGAEQSARHVRALISAPAVALGWLASDPGASVVQVQYS